MKPNLRHGRRGKAGRPLLFLDVDGPLNPFAARLDPRLNPRMRGYRTHHLTPPAYAARLAAGGRTAKPVRVRLNPAHGAELLRLGFDLVWATAWGADANTCIGPLIGLPRLPVIEWPDMGRPELEPELDGLLWKTRRLVAWSEGRPFAWVDDAITRTERRFVSARHPGPALLHQVDPRLGLRTGDFTALARWAAGH
ncbi:hypothetical protein [Streptomyces iconiensis]|uniref:Secreted protein n=1 Tax=Streptomyces iconiensis TaxID=1384038 RepID=A0ABT6ZVT5_9ACTN|nr:hypothetical protein [Streptomyces iconiensis]MDJ1133176.1 hypothetical protein [Streptomyces iconiensis]